MTEKKYYNDYENEPIGDGNPYYRCVDCGISDPQINGRLEGHQPWCKYRLRKELEIRFEELERLVTEYQSPETQRSIEIGRATEKAFYSPDTYLHIKEIAVLRSIEELLEWGTQEGKTEDERS